MLTSSKLYQLSLSFILALLALILIRTPLAHAAGPGDLDTSFGGTGVVTTSIGSNATAASVVIQPNGKIVLAGYSGDSNQEGFAVTRYYSDGSLDATFNENGIVTTTVTGGSVYGWDVALQPDGKFAGSDVFCGHWRKPPIEAEMRRLCNQLWW